MQNYIREWNGVYVSVSHSLILPWTHAYKLIERPQFLGISRIRSTSNLCFLNLIAPRYALLYLNSEIYIVHVINCEWSRSINFPLRIFCMRYKTCFSNTYTHTHTYIYNNPPWNCNIHISFGWHFIMHKRMCLST